MPQDPAELMPLVYDELRRIAAGYVRGERPGQTLQATALVNEAFVRMAAERTRHFNGRTHFLAIANFGGLPHKRVLRSMEPMARHVLPPLGS